MKRKSINSIKGNEVLARDVYGNTDTILMVSGMVLKKEYIERLKQLNVDYVYIEDGFSRESSEQRTIEERIKLKCEETVESVYERYSYCGDVELKELSQILGFQLGTQNNNINCNRLVVATDCDADGHHIAFIFLGICYKYLRKLFDDNRIVRLVTPLVVCYDKKDKPVKWFFNLNEFKNYNNENNYRVKYYKGLGSWKKEELQAIIDIQGIDSLIQPFTLDEQAEQYFNWWLATKETDKRKEFIQNYTLDLEMV